VWRGIALATVALVVFSQLFKLDVALQPKFKLSKKNSLAPASDQTTTTATTQDVNLADLQSKVVPADGVVLPITWGDLGKKMIADGVIDEEKFRGLFKSGLEEQDEAMLVGSWNEPVVMNSKNSRFLLDVLWAFGLANKNPILTQGEMTSEKYGGDASKFASTGGWSISKGKAMDHYSKYSYIALTGQQQALVEKVSKGIYRPCCGNSTYFPDCNHGMAMLGLLEIMAAQGATEQEMYQASLKANSYWFPQTYIDLATYFKEQGQSWDQVDPKLVLSAAYSSGQGYQQTRDKIQSLPAVQKGGGSCGA
jgi:hypothetical protein